jgi:hypothetical protein
MPAGIDTPGFVEEEKEKPAVTRKIEESDDQISAEKCAEYLIAGESFLPFPLSPSPFPLVLVFLPQTSRLILPQYSFETLCETWTY